MSLLLSLLSAALDDKMQVVILPAIGSQKTKSQTSFFQHFESQFGIDFRVQCTCSIVRLSLHDKYLPGSVRLHGGFVHSLDLPSLFERNETNLWYFVAGLGQ